MRALQLHLMILEQDIHRSAIYLAYLLTRLKLISHLFFGLLDDRRHEVICENYYSFGA